MDRDRVDYKRAAQDARNAIDTAVQAGCSAAALRTLTGVLYYTSLYHRSEDRILLKQIAKAVGLDGSAAERQVGRHLRELHQAGAVEYWPAHGKGLTGLIRVPKVAPPAPVNAPKTGANGAQNWRERRPKLARLAPPPEGRSEGSPLAGEAAHGARLPPEDDCERRDGSGEAWLRIIRDNLAGSQQGRNEP